MVESYFAWPPGLLLWANVQHASSCNSVHCTPSVHCILCKSIFCTGKGSIEKIENKIMTLQHIRQNYHFLLKKFYSFTSCLWSLCWWAGELPDHGGGGRLGGAGEDEGGREQGGRGQVMLHALDGDGGGGGGVHSGDDDGGNGGGDGNTDERKRCFLIAFSSWPDIEMVADLESRRASAMRRSKRSSCRSSLPASLSSRVGRWHFLSRERDYQADKNLSDLRRSVGHQEDPGGEGDQDEGDDGDAFAGFRQIMMMMNITMQCHVL